jgi:mannose/fructose/N-acetylgalactosamine-specific phosphotransferase system component IIC
VQILFAGAGAALLSLDRTLIGQWMLSRPVVLGPVLGWILGDTVTGWWIGLMFELFSFDAEPVGGKIPLNGSLGVSAALLAALGPWRAPIGAAFPLGLALGAAHRFAEERLRRRRGAWTPVFASALREGRGVPWKRAIASSLAEDFAATAALLALAAALAPALVLLWARLPVVATRAMEDAVAFVPLIGIAVLIKRLARKG